MLVAGIILGLVVIVVGGPLYGSLAKKYKWPL